MLSRLLVQVIVTSFGFAVLTANADNDALSLVDYEAHEGFIDLFWDDGGGRMLMRVTEFDEPFIYQVSLPRGVGSNDLGLDRGQLGATKVVRFIRSGPKVLLIEDNLAYRASSDNDEERQVVFESFARSVIWGFEAIDHAGDSPAGVAIVDATAFFIRDAHGVVATLSAAGEGTYSVDASRSAMYLPRTKAFPDNTEVEAIVTFTGEPTGPHLSTVVPDARAVTVHVHHSFIRLPDDDYEPLPYDPRGGVWGLRSDVAGFSDYATPIGDNLSIDYGGRHRLRKVDPTAAMSEAVEPIVYYLDRGVPEPVRSALVRSGQAPDIVVVGAGNFGNWTALHLQRMGAKVTLLDQYGPGNSRSASGGETRGVRSSYGDVPHGLQWGGWAVRAMEKWKAWDEQYADAMLPKLFYTTGDIIMRDQMTPFLEQTVANWDVLGRDYEVLTADEVRYR
ncbi:MAG: FAD-dependent oxidoreductase, partial [Proteobacteria bacterium]|nr:FAD-dependent oxidoreductase [Pseudomonadota bacterium]